MLPNTQESKKADLAQIKKIDAFQPLNAYVYSPSHFSLILICHWLIFFLPFFLVDGWILARKFEQKHIYNWSIITPLKRVLQNFDDLNFELLVSSFMPLFIFLLWQNVLNLNFRYHGFPVWYQMNVGWILIFWLFS